MNVWLQAARLRTLPLAAACVLTGSAAANVSGTFKWSIFSLTLLTTFFLQVLSNFANDYGDAQNGADNEERTGPKRAVQSGLIDPRAMLKAMLLFALLSLVSGLALLYWAFKDSGISIYSLVFLLLGLVAIAAAIKYTAGKNPYGYSGFGDLSVLLFFGFLGVMGTYFMHAERLPLQLVAPALCIGCLSTAVLNLNNLRDHIGDQLAGKRTIIVRIGFRNGKVYHLVLVVVAIISGWITTLNMGGLTYISLIALIIPLLQLRIVFKSTNGQDLDPELKKTALSTFLFALLLFIFSWLTL